MSATQKTISWFLMVTICLVTFFPAHYHIYHLYSESDFGLAEQHAHAVDLHVLSTQVGDAHQDEAASFTASPDGRLNKINPDFPLFVLLVVVLLLLPIQGKKITTRLIFSRIHFRQHCSYFSPLLRAPPVH